MFENYVLQMASSSTYAFFNCHYAFQKFPFFCVSLCVLHSLQNATESHSAEHATQVWMVQFLSINFFSWISSIFVGFFKSSRFFVSLCICICIHTHTHTYTHTYTYLINYYLLTYLFTYLLTYLLTYLFTYLLHGTEFFLTS